MKDSICPLDNRYADKIKEILDINFSSYFGYI